MQKRSLFPVFIFLIIVGLASGPMLSQQVSASTGAVPVWTAVSLTPAPQESPSQADNPYFSADVITLPDGRELEKQVINGPPSPPEAYLAQRTKVTALNRSATILPDFPSYSWVFGCSAVSGAMIAGYYDRNGYPDLYTGPTNGGLMPLTDTSWSSWTDSSGYSYPSNPLVASRSDLDGRTTRGSIEDYWVSYFSYDDDPYITGGWTEHNWGSAIGDFMKTSQSAYGNIDGGTAFYNWNDGSKLDCSTMTTTSITQQNKISDFDGTYGRKLFYEDRGYSVSDCYNQPTDETKTFYFSLDDFKAEIGAGNPVLLNLRDHSVVGFGYDGSNIFIRDTWDSDPSNLYTMPWDGCLQTDNNGCLALESVSVVRLGSQPVFPPADFNKTNPTNFDVDLSADSVQLKWQSSSDASSYEVCYDTTDDGTCNNWVNNGTSTTKELTGLEDGNTYFWQVRAVNDGGITYADGSSDAFWQFTTDINPPGEFAKLSPSNGDTGVNLPVTLSWSESENTSTYDVCVTTSEAECTDWTSAGASTTFIPDSLQRQTTYYWQVRSVNEWGEIYADGSKDTLWGFTTDIDPPGDFAKLSPGDGDIDLHLPVTLSWNPSANASYYEVCYGISEVDCTNWISNGTGTTRNLTGLEEGKTYFWQVRAVNNGGETYADGSADAYWQFSTHIDPPGDFIRLGPVDGDIDVTSPVTLSWVASDRAAYYEVCVVTSETICTKWIFVGTSTTFIPSDLQAETTYYWQIRAVNDGGYTYADGIGAENYWAFTTEGLTQIFLPMVFRD